MAEPFSTVQVNAPIPDWTLPDSNGTSHHLAELGGPAGTAVFFMRGFWCPICTKQIQQLRLSNDRFEELGFKVVVVMTDDPTRVAGSLYANPAPFPVLLDIDRAVTDQYGVRDRWSFIPTRWTDVPRPSCFLTDRDGIVRFTYIGRSPNDRPAMTLILETAEEIAHQPAAS